MTSPVSPWSENLSETLNVILTAFLVGTMAQVSHKISELDQSLQNYTQLVFDSRMSDEDEIIAKTPFATSGSLASAKQKHKGNQHVSSANWFTLDQRCLTNLNSQSYSSQVCNRPAKWYSQQAAVVSCWHYLIETMPSLCNIVLYWWSISFHLIILWICSIEIHHSIIDYCLHLYQE